MNTTTPEVEDYFAKLPDDQRKALEDIRRLVQSILPEWHEEIKTRIPAIRYKGKTVVALGAFQEHVGLYVMFGRALKRLESELAEYDASSTVVRFRPDKPLPEQLVQKIVAIRVDEINRS